MGVPDGRFLVRQDQRFHWSSIALSLLILVVIVAVAPLWWGRALVEVSREYGRVGGFVFLAVWGAVVVLHELSHGFAARVSGSRVRYGALVAWHIIPYAMYAHALDPLPRRAWIWVLLAPQFGVNTLLVLVLLFDHGAWGMIALQALVACSGSSADAICLVRVLRARRADWIQDSKAGLLIAAPPV